MSGKIYAPNKSNELTGDPNDPSNKYGDITGTSVGDKRGLDTFDLGYTAFNSPDGSSKMDTTESHALLESIHLELKEMNFHLSVLTGEKYK